MGIIESSLAYVEQLAQIPGFDGLDMAKFYAFKSNLPVAWANIITGHGILSHQEIDDIIDYFGTTPFTWAINKSEQDLLGNALTSGFREMGTVYQMELEPTKFVEVHNPEIHIVKVTDLYGLEKWVETVSTGFGLKIDYVASFYLPIFISQDPHFEFFLATFGSDAAAACFLFRSPHGSQLHSVCTLQRFRNKKAATSLICTLIARELKKNATRINVDASEPSLKLFSKLGFRVAAECDNLIMAKDDDEF